MKQIKITPTQADAVKWAMSALEEYWCDHDAEGVTENDFPNGIPDSWTFPTIDGDILTLSDWDEINDDLAYRIGTQLVEMAEDNTVQGDVGGTTFFTPQKANALIRSYISLAEKIA